MKSMELITNKLQLWAKRHNIPLVGSETIRGEKNYCKKLEDNLYLPLTNEVRKMIDAGDGGELKSSGMHKSKMTALHSSSAIGVNIFQYWMDKEISIIASACGFCKETTQISESIHFEEKFIISGITGNSPNIDVVIKNKKDEKIKAFAIECKYTEAYRNKEQSGIAKQYLDADIWKDLPNLQELATQISLNDQENKYLHRAQLVKHILGLNTKYKSKSAFKLLYLWYDVLGEDGAKHREEIEKFKKVAIADKINFISITYQELIIKLYQKHYGNHKNYIDYLASRYL
ncbi:hypothetical protein JEZ13_05535 [bacterium]|nr:hypothetical protein [bacterium]